MARDKQPADDSPPRVPVRLWSIVAAGALLWLIRFGIPIFTPGATLYGVIGGVVGGVALVVWWASSSRAPRSERWGAVVLMIVTLGVTSRLLHESIATAGMGTLFFLYAIPVLSLVLVVWTVACRHLPDRRRRATLIATIVLTSGAWTLLRSDGMTGDGAMDFAWRWTETPEERLLARTGDEPSRLRSAPATKTAATGAHREPGAEWPGFRGPDRNGIIPGLRIETDWSGSPPVELWRRPIGPGISSFAVRGDLLFTQEQRGDDEVVASYNVATGEPVWQHRDTARFWDSHAGAGPRSTPTLSDGRVYTFGPTGIVNALDAGTGAVLWSRNAASDTHAQVPGWGFASSPLVVDDVVIIAASGALVAYDLVTGHPRWTGPDPVDGESYSSPHLLTIDGVEQVVVMSAAGATSVAPADGTVLWEHSWPGAPIVQPAQTADGDVLLSTAGASGALGIRRIAVARGHTGWTLEERWTSNRLKPYFSDFVVHDGHAYGFDGSILACIDLADGTRTWKGGRYGHGQLVLLADQNLLLVLSERGELALVDAVPAQFTERGRFPAIKGKTWTHPVLVDDILLVRNDHEMVAFRLSLAGG